MVKYVGIQNNKIVAISNSPFRSDNMKIMVSSLEDPLVASLDSSKKILSKSISEAKIAFVGNWKMICGISTYSEKLWPEIASHFGSFRLFIEENSSPTGPFQKFGEKFLKEDDVVVCWKRGESIDTLIKELKEFDPDIILIQHEYGLWNNAGRWLSLMSQLSKYNVYVTMHSIFHHKDKTIVEASIPNIIVHLEGAKKVLEKEKKVSGRVSVIPHGCDQMTSKEKYWNIYRTSRTFIQAGFGFHYKGWETSLKATSLLQKKYPDVFFTGIFSESEFNKTQHELYYQELMQLAESLQVSNNVGFVRGYQSDEVLDSFFRTNSVAVFPYVSTEKHEVFGASGAARLAMSKSIPVITSCVNHFEDLPTVKIADEYDLARELEKMFEDWKYKKRQMEIQEKFIIENSWQMAALSYIKIFSNQ